MSSIKNNLYTGFTLVELLVVVGIIGVLIALSGVAYQSAKSSSRDAKRRGDLENIRSALEMYRTDCGDYPASISFGAGTSIIGDGTPTSCSASNTYLAPVPADISTTYNYIFYSTGSTYSLCAYLENGSGTVDCNTAAAGNETCGNAICNYKVTNP